MARYERVAEAKATAQDYVTYLATEEYLGGLVEAEYFAQHFQTEIVVLVHIDGSSSVTVRNIGKRGALSWSQG